jgi:tight adherence protein C
MEEWLWLGLLFVLVTALSCCVMLMIVRRHQRVEERLRKADDEGGTGGPAPFVLGEMTPALAGQIPMSPATEAELRKELRSAGYYQPSAVLEYAAIRAVLVLLPLLAAGVLAMLADRPQIPVIAISGVVLAVLGFSLPRLYINFKARTRSRQIERGLPVAIDLLTLGLTGGQNVLAALGRVAHELRFSFPVLAYELEITRRQAELHSLDYALRQLADRVRVPEVRNLTVILTQSERLGTDVGTSLLEFSTNFRTTLRQRADTQANRAAFWMLFPTLFCFWLPAAVILIGPVVFEFMERGSHTKDILENRAKSTEEMRNRIRQRAPSGGQGTVNGNNR